MLPAVVMVAGRHQQMMGEKPQTQGQCGLLSGAGSLDTVVDRPPLVEGWL
jgi:hypothetical protein